ncbi:MAG: helix-turn-helix transcriptional regulator [Candidatus Rokubacteria bacterium]|nr:helix-turn-helix transcriptional regulator [Candidatus Rokubacteria bacterium]
MPSERSLPRLVGERLRSFRLRKSFTQRELAQRVSGGVDLSYIGRIERGEQLPSLKVLQKLGHALGAGVGEFFGREPVERVGRLTEPHPALWRMLQRLSSPDVRILLAVARLLARRRGTAARYRGARRAVRLAAEQRPRYRRRRAGRR